MTREEAIKELSYIADEMPSMECGDWKEALHIAIEALKQEPCEDAISRKEVLNQIFYSTDNSGDVVLGSVLRRRIENLPSVRPQEPKSGHWDCGDDMFEYAICSSCKHETGEAWEYAKRNFKYCPNCGAKMESAECQK